MKPFPEFVLASRSPRRCELLRRGGYRFTAVPPPVSEPQGLDESVPLAQVAQAMAYFKAASVRTSRPHDIILGADTIVAGQGEIFGKAKDQADARRILSALSATRHAVTTGLALLLPTAPAGGGRTPPRLLASETTFVTMRRISDAEIEQYVDSGEWRDKAGAYAIQETADAFVKKIEGSFSNVVGLPMEKLGEILKEFC